MTKRAALGRLDHVAVVVPDTGAATEVWNLHLGFPFLFSEVVQDGQIRLTHLDIGGCHLQLVEPLTPDHALQKWLKEHGTSFHHICFEVSDIDAAVSDASPYLLAAAQDLPHEATLGRRAVFLDNTATSVIIELTGL